ncbi:MAG: L,D-transpeptidase [Desulfomonilaceae bacterium]
MLRNIMTCLGLLLALPLGGMTAAAQMYYPGGDQYSSGPGQQDVGRAAARQYYQQPTDNLQYDSRDAEMILRDQMSRTGQPQAETDSASQQQMYDNYYGHRIQDEGQIRGVVREATNIAGMIRHRNGKSFIVIDKRNFQFYLYDAYGKLLRIGPVAIGKGRTNHGAFETPVGIFPIKSKVPVADWVRPDWYFIEEGEPIPRRYEDRRVPGFFRYKLAFSGSRYIHYAEATGGRLTHGCLGLDWQDAEAVFHTLQVGSYCIVADQSFFTRLARGEFPIQKPADNPSKPEVVHTTAVTAKADFERGGTRSNADPSPDVRVFNNLW